jgi:hypothetical protein
MERPQLNLRDFFWTALVVAMALGWWLDRVPLADSLAAERRSYVELATEMATTRAELLEAQDQKFRLLEICLDRNMALDVHDLERIQAKTFSRGGLVPIAFIPAGQTDPLPSGRE